MSRAVDASRPNRLRHVSLRRSAEFARVYRSGARRRAGEVLVISLSGESGPARVGIVAGRRIGGAVVRNRAKRRLRAAVAQAELPHGSSYVIVALSNLRSASFADLVGWLRQGAGVAEKETEHGE